MTKKEQKRFIEDALTQLKRSGIIIEHFLNYIDISRTHWFFLKNGERPLTDENEKNILEFINKRCVPIE